MQAPRGHAIGHLRPKLTGDEKDGLRGERPRASARDQMRRTGAGVEGCKEARGRTGVGMALAMTAGAAAGSGARWAPKRGVGDVASCPGVVGQQDVAALRPADAQQP
jgi:hypothetical protein